VPAAQVAALQLRVDSATRALAAARQRLVSLTDIRAVDVEVGRAELAEATRNEERARAEYSASILRSPIDGRVLEISARPGEQVGERGVLQVAPTDPMYVVAEVAESDIQRIKIGQRATISGTTLSKPIAGSVARVAMQVQQNQLMPVDPARFSDGRVVDVWVQVEDPQMIANLINLRVDVVFQP
jgi:HlyD family secretion protein